MHNALLDAERLGMETVQVFSKNQQQWRCKPLEEEAISRWRSEADRLKFSRTVCHDSYLINLASPQQAMWEQSVAAFTEELSRCAALGIAYLVTHPGAHLGAGEAAGLVRVAEGLDRVHAELPDVKTITCLEITAGQGSSLGWRLEHLATIIDKVREPERLGVCLDTAHLFAAGYDFRGRKYDDFRRELQRTIGLRNVKVLHLNDSKKELGSRVDRHEHIGLGKIGKSGFAPFVGDSAFQRVPKILETPKGKRPDGREWDAVNLEVLRAMLP